MHRYLDQVRSELSPASLECAFALLAFQGCSGPVQPYVRISTKSPSSSLCLADAVVTFLHAYRRRYPLGLNGAPLNGTAKRRSIHIRPRLMPHFPVGAPPGPLRRTRNNRPRGEFSDPNDGKSVPESNACSNPRVQLVGGREIDRKRRLHPRRRRGLALAYSEGCRLVSAGSDSVQLQEQENNVHNAFKLRAVLADSLSSAIGNAHSAFVNAFGFFTTTVGAAYRSKNNLYPTPTKLSNSPPKLIMSISRDDDMMSTDESTSVMSLSGVSSYGIRSDAGGSGFGNAVCVIIAALLAFAHICILPNGVDVLVSSTSLIQEPVAIEVPIIIETMEAQTLMIPEHLPTPFFRQSPHSFFGARSQRPTKGSPQVTPKECISFIAKSRAEERLKKIHDQAQKGASIHVREHSVSKRNTHGRQLVVMDGPSHQIESNRRPSIWRLLGASFVPALIKAAG